MSDGIFGKLHASLIADTTKAVDTDFLASDFQMEREDSICRITVVAQSAVVLELVPSTGTRFALNAGSTLTANSVYTFDVPLDMDRTWNIQSATTGNTVLSYLYVQELSLVA